MLVPQKALNGRHLTISLFRRVMERKWRQMAEEEAREGTDRELTAYGTPLFQFNYSKYLGRVIAAENND